MKRYLPVLFALTVGLSILACQKKQDHADGIKSLEINEIEEVEANYTISRIVPLETTADNLLGDNLLVKTLGNNIFIYDGKARNAIHRFNLMGKYLGKVVEAGEA